MNNPTQTQIKITKKYLKYKNKYINSKKTNNIGETIGPIKMVGSGEKSIKAIAFFNNVDGIRGTVRFEETESDAVKILVDLTGFKPNSAHGFHVHESGDLTKGCDSMCAHFNPYGKFHGAQTDGIDDRHVGDLGNIYANEQGNVQMEIIDPIIKLSGEQANIIGRGLIIHADPDDCGKGNNPDSKITGNSGKRIGCAIIGYASVH